MTIDERVSLQLGRYQLELMRLQTMNEQATSELAALKLKNDALEKQLAVLSETGTKG